MRRFGLAAVTCLQGAVACGSVFGFEDPVFDTSVNADAGSDGGTDVYTGPVVDTPIAPGDPSRTCVPKPPADWQGPLIIFEGSGSPPPEPPECPSGYRTDAVYDGNTNLVAADAACTCECAPEATDCDATVVLFADKDCKNPCGTPQKVTAPANVCTALTAACAFGKMTAATYEPGTCAPSTKSKSVPPTTWAARGRVCAPIAPSEAGCPVDRIATPTTGLPFTTNTYCIAKSGEDTCPTTYPRQRVYYAAISDGRDCDCTCGAPTGGGCSGSGTLSDSTSDCVAGAKSIVMDGQCRDTKKPAVRFQTTSMAGKCAPESHPKGNATPTTPTTICCTR